MQLTTEDTKQELTISEDIFDWEYNEGLIHQAVVTCLNHQRSGNSAQKTRSEVSGGGRKPWRQKGTGRARAGTIRSPIWRSGGVTFAAKKRDYSQKINKKMYKRAMRAIISALRRSGHLKVVSDFQCETHKTKDFAAKMHAMSMNNALILMKDVGENEYLGARNLPNYQVATVFDIDPVSLLRYENVLMTEDAVKVLEERLA